MKRFYLMSSKILNFKFMLHITISGLPGSGTTVQAELLSEVLGLKIWNTGTLFRKWAKRREMKPHEFGHFIRQNPEIDKKLDAVALQIIKKSKKPLIYEGRLAGWLTKKYKIPAFRIWLSAPQKIRFTRVKRRDKLNAQEARKEVILRGKEEIKRYKEIYGIDLRDFSAYDMVIRTDGIAPTKVRDKIIKKFKSQTAN